MSKPCVYSWILDSGGAGRGAWQGGVIHEFMRWSRENGCFPPITMGASAGGYAAADVATGTERTVMKGWTMWGKKEVPPRRQERSSHRSFWGMGRFRAHLHASIHYVMEESEISGIFESGLEKRLLVFTTRVRRRDRKPIRRIDELRFFLKSATRKLPKALKYFPEGYVEEPVIFATNLPAGLHSEYVRPLSRENYHRVIEASCLVPFAMGSPLTPEELNGAATGQPLTIHAGDRQAAFIDGGYALKIPMRTFDEDARFQPVASWIAADKTIVFCCDPKGSLWETSSRLRSLNEYPKVAQAVEENRLLVVHPDHKVEAGFLCTDNPTVMRTFERGRKQARRLLRSDRVRRFFESRQNN